MLNKKEQELSQLFMALGEAEKLHLDGSIKNSFNQKLKGYLKDYFGDDISFSDNDTYGYISGIYKNIGIEIKTWCGIILSVQDEKKANVLNDFVEPFTTIVGNSPICGYNFCFSVDGKRLVYPTIEWSIEPQIRLDSLVMQAGNPMCQTIKDFKDYHLSNTIKELGVELFTESGYKRIFDTTHSNRILDRHRLQQIQKLNPSVDFEEISEWYATYRKQYPNVDIKQYRK